jgi:phosphoserine aminotransferase
MKEAKLFGHIEIAGSSAADHFHSIPEKLVVSPTATYLHITTNETIAGTQWHHMPFEYGVPLVADMCSDIMSREMDFNRFDLFYASAQKNLGAAGVNLVVVNKNILGKTNRAIPTILDYRNHIRETSMLNTPPVFAVYVCMLMLEWIRKQGGIPAMDRMNRAKAGLFYDTLDALPLFHTNVAKKDRSLMNAVFTIRDEKLEKEFLAICKKENMVGVKGHRSVGGFRVSMYNALTIDHVKAITDLMKHFAEKNG